MTRLNFPYALARLAGTGLARAGNVLKFRTPVALSLNITSIPLSTIPCARSKVDSITDEGIMHIMLAPANDMKKSLDAKE